MTDLIALCIYITISFGTMILLAFIQRLGIVNKDGNLGIVLSGLAWWLAWPMLAWLLFYYKALSPILSTIKGNIK